LSFPYSVVIDNSGYIYVADPYSNRVQKFTTSLTPVVNPTHTLIPTQISLQSALPSPSEINYVLPAIVIGVALTFLIISLVAKQIVGKRKKNPPKKPAITENNGSHDIRPLAVSNNHIFISYVEEDAKIVKEIAENLESEGFATWYYERDSIPGQSYILATSKAIEQSKAVILILSRESLRSNQIHSEVVYAHEKGIHFIPILNEIAHEEFQQRRPEWRRMLADSTSIRIPKEGTPTIMPRLIAGLVSLGAPKKGEVEQSSEKQN
jgi:TIR domain